MVLLSILTKGQGSTWGAWNSQMISRSPRCIFGARSEVCQNDSRIEVYHNLNLGTVRDYYVVYTLTETLQGTVQPQVAHLPRKDFFWCSSSNFIFSSLPTVGAEQSKQLSEIHCLFSGEFDTVLIESQEPPKVIDAAAGIVLPPKHLTELDRLAVTVRNIDRECFSVPRGSHKYTPLHCVKQNEAFKGLNKKDAFDLGGW